jgi:hypothetical protein
VVLYYIHKIIWEVQFFKNFFVLLQILNDPSSSVPGETKETEETIQQVKMRTHIFCPPQGILNKIITDGM